MGKIRLKFRTVLFCPLQRARRFASVHAIKSIARLVVNRRIRLDTSLHPRTVGERVAQAPSRMGMLTQALNMGQRTFLQTRRHTLVGFLRITIFTVF